MRKLTLNLARPVHQDFGNFSVGQIRVSKINAVITETPVNSNGWEGHTLGPKNKNVKSATIVNTKILRTTTSSGSR